MARTRISVKCVVHASPNGKALFGRIEWLLRKLHNGTLTLSEQDELAGLLAKHKSPEFKPAKTPLEVVVSLGGTWKVRISFEEYKTTYSNFKVVEEIW